MTSIVGHQGLKAPKEAEMNGKHLIPSPGVRGHSTISTILSQSTCKSGPSASISKDASSGPRG